MERSIRLLLDSVEVVHECHKPPSAACSALALALGKCGFSYVAYEGGVHKDIFKMKNTQTVMSVCPMGRSRKMAACKTRTCHFACTEICSAQHEKTGRPRIKTANADRNPTFQEYKWSQKKGYSLFLLCFESSALPKLRHNSKIA